jgi:hydroxymethylglutaryl-CoA lyase
MPNPILIHEVGPRDGLQIEKAIISTEKKIVWIEKLIAAGVDVIQLGSFVNPDKVPQMADTEKLFAHFRQPGRMPANVALSALVLNEKGLERGLACGVEFFCMGVSASDTHSRKNTGMSTDEALGRITAMAKRAMIAGATVQVSVQSAFGCGFEGAVPQRRILEIVDRYVEAGVTMVSLADTAGHANPRQVEDLYGAIHEVAPHIIAACHFHDTFGMAMANAWSAMRSGVRYVESSVGGLGGCPFTAVSAGNLATEDFVHMVQRMGVCRNVSLETLREAATLAEELVGHKLPGRIHVTGPIPEPELVTA